MSGTAPNRIFNIEWRTVYFAAPTTTANHELRLYEGQSRFDVIYGALASGNSSATAGVQKSTDFDQYFCDGSGGAATGGQSYILQSCGTPTPTPTATATATATATPQRRQQQPPQRRQRQPPQRRQRQLPPPRHARLLPRLDLRLPRVGGRHRGLARRRRLARRIGD